MTKEELRMKNALMDYNLEIKSCKKIIATKGVSAANRKGAEQSLKSAEQGKKQLLEIIKEYKEKEKK